MHIGTLSEQAPLQPPVVGRQYHGTPLTPGSHTRFFTVRRVELAHTLIEYVNGGTEWVSNGVFAAWDVRPNE